MKHQKDDLIFLKHINDAIEKILEYTSKNDFEIFIESDWDQDAVMRNLEVIGEAAARISNEFKLNHPIIEWKEMKDMRNVLIHDYSEVDAQLVWQTITEDIPSLHKKITQLFRFYTIF